MNHPNTLENRQDVPKGVAKGVGIFVSLVQVIHVDVEQENARIQSQDRQECIG